MTRKQRRRAWGSITEAKRGKKYILRWQENTPCGRKRKTKTVYGTYREACTELDRIHVERANDKPVPTIAQAYGTWLEPTMAAQVSAGTLAPNTRNLVTRSWANYVGPTWGSMPVDQLRPVHLQEWLLTLPAAMADTALLTLRKIYGTVSGFVVLPIDPFAATVKYTMPTRKTRERSKRLYTLAEAKDILERLHGTSLEAPFIMACFGSCRSGESLGIRIDEVLPFATGSTTLATVDLVRQMEQARFMGSPSPRSASHSEPAARRSPAISSRRPAASGSTTTVRMDFRVLSTPSAVGSMPGMCNHRWKKWCKAEGVEHIPWSNLRNSWRTICEMELHMPWDLMEMLMGHSLPGVSGRHYIRPSREQVARSVCDALGINWDISQQTSR